MRVLISHFHENTGCTWCKRETEGVTAEFDGGFLERGPLCWKCLQQATRVHYNQTAGAPQTDATKATGKSNG